MCIHISKYRMLYTLIHIRIFAIHVNGDLIHIYIYMCIKIWIYNLHTKNGLIHIHIFIYEYISYSLQRGFDVDTVLGRHICMCDIPLTWLIFECECLAYDTWCVICETCFIHMHLITHLCVQWGKQTYSGPARGKFMNYSLIHSWMNSVAK